MVDDEYATANVEDLLGICAEIDPTLAAELPHLEEVDFDAPQAIWTDRVRETWETLDRTAHEELLARALAHAAEAAEPSLVSGDDEPPEIDDATAASSLAQVYQPEPL